MIKDQDVVKIELRLSTWVKRDPEIRRTRDV